MSSNRYLLTFSGYFAILLHIGVFAYLNEEKAPPVENIYCNYSPPPEIEVTMDNSGKMGRDIPNNESQQVPGDPSQAQPPAAEMPNEEQGELNVDPEKWGSLLDRLDRADELGNAMPDSFEDTLPNTDVPDSYINRKRDYEDIIVKDVFPTLDSIDKPFSEILNKSPQELQKYQKRNEIIEDYRRYKDGTLPQDLRRLRIIQDSEDGDREVLTFPQEERQQYFDRTLRDGKEQQLNEFLAKYGNYDPDQGDLPMAIRELYYKNLQRLAYVFSPDPTYFMLDYFQENLNKEDFLKNSLYLVSKNLGSKAATEMLFAIENIYEIQQRAWNFVFEFMRLYPNLPVQKKKEKRVYTIKEVVDRFAPLARQKGIRSYQDAVRLYSKKRLEILQTLRESTPSGYRSNDALFEEGRIYWDLAQQSRSPEHEKKAITIWQSIQDSDEEKYGDFLNRSTWLQIDELIRREMTMVEKFGVQRLLRGRVSQLLEEKKEREYSLLWN